MRKVLLALCLTIVSALGVGISGGTALAANPCNNVSSNQVSPILVGGQIVATTSFWNCSSGVDQISFQDTLKEDHYTTLYVGPITTGALNGGGTAFHYLPCPHPGQHGWIHSTTYRFHYTGTTLWSVWFNSQDSTPYTYGACA